MLPKKPHKDPTSKKFPPAVILASVCCIVAMDFFPSVGFSQEKDAADTETEAFSFGSLRRIITGDVESVNQGAGTLTIKQLIDGQSSIYKKITVVVDGNTAISKGFGVTSFSGIHVGDKATVEYRYEPKTEKNIAISILVVASEIVRPSEKK